VTPIDPYGVRGMAGRTFTFPPSSPRRPDEGQHIWRILTRGGGLTSSTLQLCPAFWTEIEITFISIRQIVILVLIKTTSNLNYPEDFFQCFIAFWACHPWHTPHSLMTRYGICRAFIFKLPDFHQPVNENRIQRPKNLSWKSDGEF